MSLKNVPIRTYRFEILRYDEATQPEPRMQCYDVRIAENKSVLEGLLTIQNEQDPSLAFRYACRGAVCGSCGMSINGQLNLACRVLLKNLKTDRVVLEPLPNLAVLKDLIVDMDGFWEKYRRIQPWLHTEIKDVDEARMSEVQRERINQYFDCILCGICYGACPVAGRDANFTGPGVLAKLYRFVGDSREKRGNTTLKQEDSPSGVWGCHTIMRCVEACPKDVRPTDGITALRRKLFSRKVQELFGKKQDED